MIVDARKVSKRAWRASLRDFLSGAYIVYFCNYNPTGQMGDPLFLRTGYTPNDDRLDLSPETS